MRRRPTTTLESHPNLDEILGILARLPAISDDALRALALQWTNTVAVADARTQALSPDVPLVVEALAAFDAVQALYAEDLAGTAAYLTVDPATTSLALNAVRDAVAGAYAAPVLHRAAYRRLLAPWHSVFPAAGPVETDLGPQHTQIAGLLGSLPRLAARCHDSWGQQTYQELAARALLLGDERAQARDAVWHAAVVTSRRRLWALVRRSAAEALRRPCPHCRTPQSAQEQLRDEQRVLTLCVDAACALLVADALPDDVVAIVTAPLTALVPRQRTAS